MALLTQEADDYLTQYLGEFPPNTTASVRAKVWTDDSTVLMAIEGAKGEASLLRVPVMKGRMITPMSYLSDKQAAKIRLTAALMCLGVASQPEAMSRLLSEKMMGSRHLLPSQRAKKIAICRCPFCGADIPLDGPGLSEVIGGGISPALEKAQKIVETENSQWASVWHDFAGHIGLSKNEAVALIPAFTASAGQSFRSEAASRITLALGADLLVKQPCWLRPPKAGSQAAEWARNTLSKFVLTGGTA